MIQENCSFNPLLDVTEVDQFGFIDLAQAFVSGTIAADVNLQDLNFSEEDDPRSVNGKPQSAFDMVDAGLDIAKREGVKGMSSEKEEGA